MAWPKRIWRCRRRPARRVPGPSDGSHRSPSGADRTGPAEACRRVGKQRTRQALRQAAVRLFLERGFEATTIADIAAAAEVAPRTFFSYYQTKEDVVLGEITQRFDCVRGVLQQRPEGEPLLAAFRRAALEIAAELQAPEDQRRAARVILATPAIQARIRDRMGQWEDELAAMIASAAPAPTTSSRTWWPPRSSGCSAQCSGSQSPPRCSST